MGKDTPAAPDYKGAAEQTAASSEEVNTQQTYANRPTTKTPWGTQTWNTSQGVDPSTGKPVTKWEQNIQLTPDQQAALNDQQKIQAGRSGAAETLLGQATSNFQTPFDWGSLPSGGDRVGPAGSSAFSFGDAPGSASSYRQKAQDAVDALQEPGLKRSRDASDARLAAQGITQGSEAWKAEQQSLGDSEARAHLAAIDSGRAEADQSYRQDLSTGQFENQRQAQDTSQIMARGGADIQAGGYNQSLRQQKIAEMAQKRGMSLNELNALLTGQQVSMPNMPNAPTAGKAAGADYNSAAQQGYGSALDAANINNANSSSTYGAVGTAALAALSFY